MKITFLGTSHGTPEKNRRCSSTMIEIGDNIYFIDMGFEVFSEIVNHDIDPKKIRALFFTHMHGDHTDGLLPFLDKASWAYHITPHVYLPNLDCVEILRALIKWTGEDMAAFPFHKVEKGTVYDDGVLKVTATDSNHCPEAHSFVLEAEGKTVVFTGDLESPEIDFPDYALDKKMDLCVGEVAHFSAVEYAKPFGLCNPAKIVFNHYCTHNFPNIEELKTIINRPDIVLATDNMELTV